MATGYKSEIVKILRENGCSPVKGGKGSHGKWHSPHTDRIFTVPEKCKSRHTANAVMKQAGIDHKF